MLEREDDLFQGSQVEGEEHVENAIFSEEIPLDIEEQKKRILASIHIGPQSSTLMLFHEKTSLTSLAIIVNSQQLYSDERVKHYGGANAVEYCEALCSNGLLVKTKSNNSITYSLTPLGKIGTKAAILALYGEDLLRMSMYSFLSTANDNKDGPYAKAEIIHLLSQGDPPTNVPQLAQQYPRSKGIKTFYRTLHQMADNKLLVFNPDRQVVKQVAFQKKETSAKRMLDILDAKKQESSTLPEEITSADVMRNIIIAIETFSTDQVIPLLSVISLLPEEIKAIYNNPRTLRNAIRYFGHVLADEGYLQRPTVVTVSSEPALSLTEHGKQIADTVINPIFALVEGYEDEIIVNGLTLREIIEQVQGKKTYYATKSAIRYLPLSGQTMRGRKKIHERIVVDQLSKSGEPAMTVTDLVTVTKIKQSTLYLLLDELESKKTIKRTKKKGKYYVRTFQIKKITSEEFPIVENEKSNILLDQNDLDTAFTNLYNTYYQPIFRYVNSHISNYEAAEDITQRVFENLWKALPNIPNFFTEGFPQSSYIYRTATNQIRDKYRRDQLMILESNDQVAEGGTSIADTVESRHNFFSSGTRTNIEEQVMYRHILGEAFEALMDDNSENFGIYWLYHYEGWEYDQIAKKYGISVPFAKVRSSRAKQFLVKYITSKYSYVPRGEILSKLEHGNLNDDTSKLE